MRFKSEQFLQMSEGGKRDEEITHKSWRNHPRCFFIYKENSMSVTEESYRQHFKRKQEKKIGRVKEMW